MMKGQVGVMKKKLHALLLVLVLILCQLPQITAAAEEEGAGEPAAEVSIETKGEERPAPAQSSGREDGSVQEKAGKAEKTEPEEEKAADFG